MAVKIKWSEYKRKFPGSADNIYIFCKSHRHRACEGQEYRPRSSLDESRVPIWRGGGINRKRIQRRINLSAFHIWPTLRAILWRVSRLSEAGRCNC